MSKFNIQKAIAKAAKQTNMNEPVKGGGGAYTPPAKGAAGLRFVAYVELGPQEETYQNQQRIREKVKLVFECHGKRWPVSENGQPPRITVTLTKSLHEKSTLYKLFKAMNYAGTATHMAELLGEDFIGNVHHNTWGEGDQQRTAASFKDPNTGALTIRAPFVEDEDGEPQRRNVPPAISELRLFLWDYPDMEQWRSIFIDGEYEGGKSKNVFQDAIKGSPSFEGSAVEAMLMGLDDVDEDDAEEAKTQAKTRKAKAKPAPEPEDEDDDEDGTNDIPDNTPDDDEDEPEEKPKRVQGKTPRAKNAQVKRGQVKKSAPVDDDDEDDPLGDLEDDE